MSAINALQKLPDQVHADVISVMLENTECLNLDHFSCLLPLLLGLLDSNTERHINVSLKMLLKLVAVIVRQSVDKAEFQDSSEKKLNLLFNHCESEEECVRNVVAKCLGKIALIKPSKLLPAIKDQDRHVRHATVLALSIAGHNKPNLIKGLLPELFPLLYDQTVIKKELIRTVDLGPFKHTVDDGLELRKATFECVDKLLDNCLDQMNLVEIHVFYRYRWKLEHC
ncbi:unnamed protein product [Lactuca virosa]|uniref:TATA-binding protein interacting (TIP20) domain-containing protein n=1 Tax=Lactuca virosa TaxID=75947 RepID=A0AAU9M405_9ASTR|nr:unnamed protein product [Lactuca virosa]